MEIIHNDFCTKPGNRIRFVRASMDDRLERVATLPCGGEVMFAREDSLAALYDMARSGTQYDPTIDEDRWQVLCPYRDSKACPGWDGLRKVLREVAEKVRMNDDGLVEDAGVEDDEKFPNGKACAARIRNGNGVAGPIIGTGYGEINLPEEIIEVARKCGEAAKAAQDAARADDDGKCVHGGIIAFLARLFGRGT